METIQISLSKGIYDLLKNHLKVNNKLSTYNKNKLEAELKTAKLIPNKNLPDDVVSINSNVQIRDTETQQEMNFDLVAPGEAKMSQQKLSILSPLGVALLGYYEGNEVKWEMPEGFKNYKIEKVSAVKK